MENFKNFFKNYRGAIIGIIIAIIILATRFYNVILWAVVIIIGAIVGNYVQQNKESVKDKIINFIDRM